MKKIYPKKSSYTPEKWNFLTLILKNFLAFPKNPEKIPYISGNGNPKKTCNTSRINFTSSKNEKNSFLNSFLYFGKWNFLATSLKNFLYFRKELTKPRKQIRNLLRRNFLSLYGYKA